MHVEKGGCLFSVASSRVVREYEFCASREDFGRGGDFTSRPSLGSSLMLGRLVQFVAPRVLSSRQSGLYSPSFPNIRICMCEWVCNSLWPILCDGHASSDRYATVSNRNVFFSWFFALRRIETQDRIQGLLTKLFDTFYIQVAIITVLKLQEILFFEKKNTRMICNWSILIIIDKGPSFWLLVNYLISTCGCRQVFWYFRGNYFT